MRVGLHDGIDTGCRIAVSSIALSPSVGLSTSKCGARCLPTTCSYPPPFPPPAATTRCKARRCTFRTALVPRAMTVCHVASHHACAVSYFPLASLPPLIPTGYAPHWRGSPCRVCTCASNGWWESLLVYLYLAGNRLAKRRCTSAVPSTNHHGWRGAVSIAIPPTIWPVRVRILRQHQVTVLDGCHELTTTRRSCSQSCLAATLSQQ